MANPETSSARPEQQMRRAERVLERLGAVPLDINRHNRELLGQRITYLLGSLYCRIDYAEFDGKPFLLLSAAEEKKFAEIGLMEDIDAIPADSDDETLEREFRAVLELPPTGI
ncbi:MAG: hypothetical protein IJ573_04185 [Clostridia bacterium]|nr:hypothetical protein [Clostridia bacterium]